MANSLYFRCQHETIQSRFFFNCLEFEVIKFATNTNPHLSHLRRSDLLQTSFRRGSVLRTPPPAYNLPSLRDYFELKTENGKLKVESQLSAISGQQSVFSVQCSVFSVQCSVSVFSVQCQSSVSEFSVRVYRRLVNYASVSYFFWRSATRRAFRYIFARFISPRSQISVPQSHFGRCPPLYPSRTFGTDR